MDADKTGSVGVMVAPIASAYTKCMSGITAQTIRLVRSHIRVMPMPRIRASGRHSRFKYFWGNCMPVRTSWTPRTMRVRLWVMRSRFSREALAYSKGRTRLAMKGEKIAPEMVARTVDV